MNTRKIEIEYDAGLMLYKIAELKSWEKEGVSLKSLFGGAMVPGGVIAIRQGRTANIEIIYALLQQHLVEKVIRFPSSRTTAYYKLICDVYVAREDSSKTKQLIDNFCGQYLLLEDQRLLPHGAPPESKSMLATLLG